MRPNLLLRHGAIGSSQQLNPLASELQDNYTVHLLNFAGHGGDLSDSGFSINLFASQVAQYIQQNNLAPVPVFGYSMGGYVAAYLAVHHPKLISCICTLATKFLWDAVIAAKEVKMLDAGKISEKLPEFAATLQQRHAPNNWKIVLQKTSAMLIDMGTRNLLQTEDLRSIEIPVLLLLGDRDIMVTPQETMEVYQLLPNAQLAILPGTPHPIEQMDIAQLAFQINRFVTNTF